MKKRKFYQQTYLIHHMILWVITSVVDFLNSVKLVTRFRRTADTHVTYALPIQLLPYVGIQDMEARTLMNKVIQEMVNRGMKVSGMWILQAWGLV